MTEVLDPLTESGAHLRRFLAVFTAGADGPLVTELRALVSPQQWGNPRTEFGFFDLADADGQRAFGEALKAILLREPKNQPQGVYVTLNPLAPDLMARASNRLKVSREKGETAADKHVVRRRWIPVDIDPSRISGVSSTNAEKAESWQVSECVRSDLRTLGWPAPMVCDSGNGFHLWYPLDLPTDDGGRVERALKGLAKLYDTDRVKIDTSVFNPSRIMKIPGTWARKGDSTPDRPHRMARVLEIPA